MLKLPSLILKLGEMRDSAWTGEERRGIINIVNMILAVIDSMVCRCIDLV